MYLILRLQQNELGSDLTLNLSVGIKSHTSPRQNSLINRWDFWSGRNRSTLLIPAVLRPVPGSTNQPTNEHSLTESQARAHTLD